MNGARLTGSAPVSTCSAPVSTSINSAAGGDRPELLDAVGADADIPVVEVDGRVAVAGNQADLVAEPESVGGGRGGEPAVLVGGALVGRGGLVADGGPESKASALRRASTTARSSAGRLMTVAQTKRLGSKTLVGAPARSRLRP